MFFEVFWGVFLPFFGTALGALCVLFMRSGMNERTQKCLNGFAGGVMVAASVWSLLIPAIDQSATYGALAFLPATVGFLGGILFLLLLDILSPREQDERAIIAVMESDLPIARKRSMLFLSITLHNIPEGVAVGIAYASLVAGSVDISAYEALALSLGIAIQNFPEGAIVSMPMASCGSSRSRALGYGIVSGIVEPVFALITILLSELLLPVFPYLLAFASGAMIFVVVEELIPEMSERERDSHLGTLMFALGFCVMMSLDVALG